MTRLREVVVFGVVLLVALAALLVLALVFGVVLGDD